MKRLVLSLLACIVLVPAAEASISPRDGRRGLDRDHSARIPDKVSRELVRRTVPAAPATSGKEYNVTDETEIVLNGRVVSYDSVPGNAQIHRMEVGPDGRTVLRIHFRTGK